MHIKHNDKWANHLRCQQWIIHPIREIGSTRNVSWQLRQHQIYNMWSIYIERSRGILGSHSKTHIKLGQKSILRRSKTPEKHDPIHHHYQFDPSLDSNGDNAPPNLSSCKIYQLQSRRGNLSQNWTEPFFLIICRVNYFFFGGLTNHFNLSFEVQWNLVSVCVRHHRWRRLLFMWNPECH